MHLQTLFQTGCNHCDLCLYQVSRPSAILTLKSSSLLTRVTVRSVMGSCIGRLETFCLHRHLSNDLPSGPQPPSCSSIFMSSSFFTPGSAGCPFLPFFFGNKKQRCMLFQQLMPTRVYKFYLQFSQPKSVFWDTHSSCHKAIRTSGRCPLQLFPKNMERGSLILTDVL